MYIAKKIKIDVYLLLLIGITLFLCYKNYTPNTFLSGWDTLHPEFNLSQYWNRITSMWQPHQGLGAPPSQAHASEIPRMVIVGFFTLIFPLSFVRYAYVFLMMLLGPVGIYLLIQYLLTTHQSHPTQNRSAVSISAFLGALFYLLNIGTVQTFIAPLEMFVTKFGYLGFLYLFTLKYLDSGRKRYLLFFSIASLLSSAMAHTATLWYVYFAGLASYIFVLSLFHHKYIKRSCIILSLALILNLFWILPNLYYSAHYGYDVINSKIHRLSSEETYYYNKKYGNVTDFLLQRNFLFDWRITTNKVQSEDLFAAWKVHLKNTLVVLIGIGLSLSAIAGALISMVKKRTRYMSFIPLLLGVSFFLLSDLPLTNTLFNVLRDHNAFIREVLRSPFTKFSLYLIFIFAVFLGYFFNLILNYFARRLKTSLFTLFSNMLLFGTTLLICFYAIPAFQGNFISKVERVRIPSEYFSLFEWSQKQDNGRMLLLPLHNMFGWVYYRWDFPDMTQIYQGAGFTWFGLKQPTLNREFDRWYPYNEQSYRELSYAVYAKDTALFKNLLGKYNITYILLDENIFIPFDQFEANKLFYPELKTMLSSIPEIKTGATFGDKITVFTYNPIQDKTLLTVSQNISPSYQSQYIDQAYLDNGNYVTGQSLDTTRLYPARNILNEKERVNKQVLSVGADNYKLTINSKGKGTMVIPELDQTERDFYGDLFAYPSNDKPAIKIKYLAPFFQEYNNIEQDIILPNKNIDSFTIGDRKFIVPQFIDSSLIYLGNIHLQFNRPTQLNYPVGKTTVSVPLAFPQIKKPQLIENNDAIEIVGNFPKEQINFDIKNLTSTISDCNFSRSQYIHKDLLNQNQEEYIQYKARGGNICDSLSFSELSHDSGYILAIESQHISGLPLQLCFEHYQSRKCIFEDELSKNTSFDTDYFIIPPYPDGYSGYRLQLSNFSIGSVESVNNIKSIRIIPFPYSLFNSIYWQKNNQSQELFTVKTNDQAYEKNWKAYFMECNDGSFLCRLKSNFPFIFGTEIKDHVLVNNWENGWVINAQDDNSNIVIIFLPQYLEFVGFGLLFLTFAILILLPQKHIKQPK